MSSPMRASPHLLVSADRASPICLLILCILVWDFLEGLTLLLYWLESTETPMFPAQSFSVITIYENLSCLRFSYLATQFIKPNPKTTCVRPAGSLHCGRRGTERLCLWTPGPCLPAPLSHTTSFMMSQQDLPTIRLGCRDSGPRISTWWGSSQSILSVVYNDETTNSTSYHG